MPIKCGAMFAYNFPQILVATLKCQKKSHSHTASAGFWQMYSDSIHRCWAASFESIFASRVQRYTDLNATSLKVAETSYFKLAIALSYFVLTFSNSGDYGKKG